MIKFSKTEDYTLMLISVLAHSYEKKLISLSQVSKEYNIPLLFLRNIANHLMHGGIIVAEEGKHGWYKLIKNPAVLTIGEVLHVVAKDSGITCCEINKKNGVCIQAEICQPALIWRNMHKEFIEKISQVSLTEFQGYTK